MPGWGCGWPRASREAAVKLTAAQVEPFLARPPAALALALVFGADAGLVAERGRRLAASAVADLADPFLVTDLDAASTEHVAGRLVEEARALSLMGGRRLIRVRNAGDRLTVAAKEVLTIADPPALVVLEAEALPARSTLRQLAERAPNAAAIACYRDDARSLPAVLRAALNGHRLAAEPDAMALLALQLGADRAATRAEIDKLALYMADRPGARVTRADVAAIIGDGSAVETDAAVKAAIDGDLAALDRALDRLLAEGADPGSLVRAVARTLTQALRLRAEIAAGKSLDGVLAGLFFDRRETMRRVLQSWPYARLVGTLAALHAAETRCRLLRGADALVCRRALAAVAGPAGRG